MKRLACLSFCLLSVLCLATVVDATVCSSDRSPASSLVYPFVVLDYSGTISTSISITNTGPAAQIVHLTVWTDYGAAILVFNIVLSGYDHEIISIRDLLVNGIVPVSSDPEGSDPAGGVLAAGPVAPESTLPMPSSSASIFDRCNSGSHIAVPSAYSVPIPPGSLAIFQNLLQMSQTQTRLHQACGGSSVSLSDWFELRDTDDPTWMWITADVVWTCNKLLPDLDSAYWLDGPTQNPSYSGTGAQRYLANVLIGDVAWTDTATGEIQSSPAIHLEADRSLGDKSYNSPILNPTTGMPQSFYHALSSASGSSDLREPLPTGWAFHYLAYQGQSDTFIRVFKAPTLTPDLSFPGIGGGTMLADDCLAYTYYAWADDGTVMSAPGGGNGGVYPNQLPLVTQEVSVSDFMIPGDFGWMMFQWPHTNAKEGDLYQTWVEVRDEMTGFGLGSTVRQAIPVANYNCDRGEIAGSGFELGNTSGWSTTKQ